LIERRNRGPSESPKKEKIFYGIISLIIKFFIMSKPASLILLIRIFSILKKSDGI
jgi:hypothetical protein